MPRTEGINPSAQINKEFCTYSEIKYLPCGETAITIEFGNEISKEINAKIRKTILEIEKQRIEGIVEIVPTYRSILLQYDPLRWTFSDMTDRLKQLNIEESGSESDTVTLIEIPTLYGGEYGPDIDFVSEHTKLPKEEVIKRHTSVDYLVYMLGFIPGFTYLGGMDETLATPRLQTPRLQIQPGSVGIAGKQTGIYPSLSPGGWQIIGRTPLKLYDAAKNPPVFIQAGDYIRYRSITPEEYQTIAESVEKGTYRINMQTVKRGDLHEV